MSDVTNKGKFTLWFINNSKNKIPSSQAKDGLTYDGISGKIHHSSALSITDMLTKVKILIWIKKIGLEKMMIDIILKNILCCSLKAEKWKGLDAG